MKQAYSWAFPENSVTYKVQEMAGHREGHLIFENIWISNKSWGKIFERINFAL